MWDTKVEERALVLVREMFYQKKKHPGRLELKFRK